MKITLVCSCGLLIESVQGSILVDAPNDNYPPFAFFEEENVQKIISAQKPFDKLQAVLFTHHHPDHYSRRAVERIAHERPDILIAQQQEQTLTVGDFSVTYHEMPHIPIPFAPMHFSLLVRCEGKSLYITADSVCDAEKHRSVLGGKKVDAAFWHGQFLSHEDTRAMLREVSEKNYIYHIPYDEKDISGIRRKCEKNMQRFGSELPNVTLLEQYPTQISLP